MTARDACARQATTPRARRARIVVPRDTRVAAAIAAAILALTACAWPVATTAPAAAPGREVADVTVRFSSAGRVVRPPNRDRYSASTQAVPLSGQFVQPAGTGPFPAVVLAHGCAGVGASEQAWAARLARHGVATLIVDSHRPRGIARTCEQPGALGPLERVPDLFGALAWLATRPHIDVDRVALVGFSAGGIATTIAATRWADTTFTATPAVRFRAFVAFYPYCNVRAPELDRIAAPLRIHIGDADDWTPAAPCVEHVARLRAAGFDADITVYPGAHHAFDVPDLPRRRMAGVPSFRDCHPVVASVLGPWPDALFTRCATPGVTIGADAGATARAVDRVLHELDALLAPRAPATAH
ncbi:MAG: dienelactone hydrolase family protein [Burkholderiales bacterium]|jgi:dienelactone hydrolase|nr:dienelactone hydrolase family protein [Burkholderiales bacterium]